MDPNTALREILLIANDILDNEVDDQDQITDRLADADTLASHVLILHEWIKKGGFLPKAWTLKTKNPSDSGKEVTA